MVLAPISICHGLDLDRLAQAESGRRDNLPRGPHGELGRHQMTPGAVAEVNKARRRRGLVPIRFGSLTNAATSTQAAGEYVEILARRIRSAGFKPTPDAIICAWNDGVADARRYRFDISRAPRETRRLAQ